MASSRTRPAPPAAQASPPDEASLAPWAPSQSLAELRDAMGSPGVIQAEVEALLTAIARPPAGDETPRARADFLLSLMDLPEEARDRTGSDGRTVRAAALEALLALGYPYALEAHPDVFEDVRRQAGGRKRGAKGWHSWLGTSATVMTLLFQLFAMATMSRWNGTWDLSQVLLLGLVTGPPLLALFGKQMESKGVQAFGAWGMAIQGLSWLLFCVTQTLGATAPDWPILFVVIPWYLPLAAAYLTHPKTEPR